MNATDLLAKGQPWEHGGKSYLLAHTDFEVELLFQAAHEAWARNRIEATRERVGERAYAADVAAFGERRDSNQYCWAGPISLAFLTTAEGQFELILLKMQKGGTEGGAKITRDRLRSIQRGEPEKWKALAAEVLERDFPLVFGRGRPAEDPTEDQSSAPATPPPSTTASASCSPDGPGS